MEIYVPSFFIYIKQWSFNILGAFKKRMRGKEDMPYKINPTEVLYLIVLSGFAKRFAFCVLGQKISVYGWAEVNHAYLTAAQEMRNRTQMERCREDDLM